MTRLVWQLKKKANVEIALPVLSKLLCSVILFISFNFQKKYSNGYILLLLYK